MHTDGGVIAGVAKATSPVRENDASRPWRELLLLVPGEPGRIVASDGYVVTEATVPGESRAAGLLRRRDAERFDKEDAISFSEVPGASDDATMLAVDGSSVEIVLDTTIADDKPYPEGPSKVLRLFPSGRPTFRVDPRTLRRALQGMILAGVESIEVYAQPKIGDGLLFLRGTNDADVVMLTVLGFPKTGERKASGGEIVEVQVASPLFPGAEEPAESPAPNVASDGAASE